MKASVTDNDYLSQWIVFTVLAASTALLLGLVKYHGLTGETSPAAQLTPFGQLLVLIAGMTTVATLGTLHALLAVSFSRSRRASSLPKRNEIDSRSLSPNELIGVDNILALAKLQIEIKLQMGRLASLSRLTHTETFEQALDAGEREKMLEAMHQVLETCEKALGEQEEKGIDDEKAGRIIALGEWLLEKAELKYSTSPA